MRMTRRNAMLGTGMAVAAFSVGRPAGAQARRILVIGSNGEITSFDPHTWISYQASFLLRNLYDGLVKVEGNPPQPAPNLASSWTVSADGRGYTFKLDPAATFQDGTPVTAEDVSYSFNRLIRLNRGSSWMVMGLIDDKSVVAQDPRTVQITLKTPFAAFLQVLPWLAVVNAKLVEAHKASDDGQAWLLANPASSGSFKLRRAETGNLWEFERRTDDWHKGGGNLSGAIWKFVRETTSQRLALQRGEIHIACDLTSEDMDALRNKSGIVEIIEPEYRTFSIKMNTENGPLTDVNLRLAVSYAYNYQGMLDAAGYGKLMTGPLPDGIFGQNPKLDVYRTDPAKAMEYLARTKLAEGRVKLTAAYVAGLESERRYLLVLLDSLRTLNIDLDIKAMGWTDMVASARSPQTVADFFCVYQTANYGDPDNIAFATYHSSRNGGWQNPVYHNSEVDKLIESGRSETDPAKRAAIYQKFQELVVADAPDIFGVLESRKLAMRSDVKNYHFIPVAANAIDLFPLSL